MWTLTFIISVRLTVIVTKLHYLKLEFWRGNQRVEEIRAKLVSRASRDRFYCGIFQQITNAVKFFQKQNFIYLF